MFLSADNNNRFGQRPVSAFWLYRFSSWFSLVPLIEIEIFVARLAEIDVRMLCV